MVNKYVIINQAEQKDDGQCRNGGKIFWKKRIYSFWGWFLRTITFIEFDKEGKPTFTLPDEAPAVKTAFALFETLFGQVQ